MGLCDCLTGPRLPEEDRAAPVRASGTARRSDHKAGTAATTQRQHLAGAPAGGQPLPKRAKQHPDRNPLAELHNSPYRKVADLNDGTSGFVQLAEERSTQHLVAIKFLPRGKKLIKDADREICNLRLCCMHPYIIKFKEAFLTNQHLAIVSEYASVGDLADYIESRRTRNRHPRGLPEMHARQLFQQLMVAVDFCHQKGIVNRDLKLENVLLADEAGPGKPKSGLPTVRLCDFGFSKDEAVDSICKTACGTPEYVAPEVLITNQYSGKAADVWSAGVVLYVMLTGQFPFKPSPGTENASQANKLKAIFPRIVNARFDRPTWVSQGSCDLLEGMLQPDLKLRFSLADVLAHPWFTEGLPESMLETNANLLRVPEGLLISTAPQTEDDILRIVAQAMDLPGKRGRGLPASGRRAHTPVLPPLEERMPQHSPVAPRDNSRPSSQMLSATPARWRMDPAIQQDYQPRMSPLNNHPQHSIYEQQQQLLHPSAQGHQQQQQDEVARAFSIASSSDSAKSSHTRRPHAGRQPSSASESASGRHSSAGSSYDELIADGQRLSSMRAPSQHYPACEPSPRPHSARMAGNASDAAWSADEEQPHQLPARSQRQPVQHRQLLEHQLPRRATSLSGFGGRPGQQGGNLWGQWAGSYHGLPPRGSMSGMGENGGPRRQSHLDNKGSSMGGGSPGPHANGHAHFGSDSDYEDRGDFSRSYTGSRWSGHRAPDQADSLGRRQQHQPQQQQRQRLVPQGSAASQPSMAGAFNLNWQHGPATPAPMMTGTPYRRGRHASSHMLPPSSYVGSEEAMGNGRAAALSRPPPHPASPDSIRQEVTRGQWAPIQEQHQSNAGSPTDSDELMSDRAFEEGQRANGYHEGGRMPSRSKHGHSSERGSGSMAPPHMDSSATSGPPYPRTPARIRTHVSTSRY